jgi:hypothetical protein
LSKDGNFLLCFDIDIIERVRKFDARHDAGKIASEVREDEASEGAVGKVQSGKKGHTKFFWRIKSFS